MHFSTSALSLVFVSLLVAACSVEFTTESVDSVSAGGSPAELEINEANGAAGDAATGSDASQGNASDGNASDGNSGGGNDCSSPQAGESCSDSSDVSCKEEAQELQEKLNAAAMCSSDDTGVNPCASPGWINDECGCPAPTLKQSGVAFDAALTASNRFAERCSADTSCPACTNRPEETTALCRSNPFVPASSFCDTAESP